MATALGSAVRTPAPAVGQRDRLFYGAMSIALAATVFAGFARTYYLRLLSGGPSATLSGGPFTPLVHAHGALFTAWVVLFVVQTALISSRRVAVHRRLGIAGAVLAGAMVVAGTLTGITTAQRGGSAPGMDPLAFLIIPLVDMVLFAGFVIAALARRRDKEAHKRLMLLAYVTIVVAAVARLPGVIALGPPGFFGLALLFVVAGVVYDFVSRRRVHPVYLWGGALLVVSIPLRLAIATTASWRAVAQLLTQ
jgi:hypothetical protein